MPQRLIVSPNSVRTALYECPNCLSEFDAATCVDAGKRQPKPGDLTVCFYCAAVLVYEETNVRPVTDDEMDGLPEDMRAVLNQAVDMIKKSLQ